MGFYYQDRWLTLKIPSVGDTLIIDASIYQADSVRIDPNEAENMVIYYYNPKADPKNAKIADFNPVFPDEEQLLTETQLLIDRLELTDMAALEEEMLLF
ncbi:MAG: hypothetical protein B6244_00430 [Candidatus Cloacimonetes bacterium 4572_55]|nr:MAG: hypothetical protein B6244_00430 [Candidatus Cloacimonetes bacterium 4572_55]